jgi:hypothetical protein
MAGNGVGSLDQHVIGKSETYWENKINPLREENPCREMENGKREGVGTFLGLSSTGDNHSGSLASAHQEAETK